MTAQSSIRVRRPAPTGSPLLREDVGNIAVLTLDRPQARNSLLEAMLTALQQELDRLAGEARIHAVVLAANGPAFSAGHDLKELTAHRADADGGRGYVRHIMESWSAMTLTIWLPQPVVAAVEVTATAVAASSWRPATWRWCRSAEFSPWCAYWPVC